ncbi:AAA family ATPase [Paracoccus sp. Ld10]|uniref:AAA family ATPase n=1 Tax=Paracoccus sp. Ld10 TaxID=649158 RepID=UPI0038630BE3
MTNPTRIFASSVITSPGLSVNAVTRRLTRHRELLRIRASARTEESDMSFSLSADDIGMLRELDACLDMGDDVVTDMADDMDPTSPQMRAALFHHHRHSALERQLGHLRPTDRPLIEAAISKGEALGIVTQHRMHERIAALHAEAPWMAPAAAAVMEVMTRATARGPAPFRTPPMILLGGPGIGKSRWARSLAKAFDVPMIDIDIGSANGATFALAGVERGYGNAAPGRVVRSILGSHVVNPLVIIDELDKVPETALTTRGSLPGMGEVIKSMIEPSTARAWTCPYYQLPFDLRRVSWIMTTNSLDRVPAPLIDRCQVIRLPDPTPADLEVAASRMIGERTKDPDLRQVLEALVGETLRQRRKTGRRTSLRQLERMVARLEAAGTAPQLM